MTPRAHDFRQPPPLASPLDRFLGTWLEEASRRISRLWSSQLHEAAEVTLAGKAPSSAEAALEPTRETSLRYRIRLEGQPEPCLLVISRSLLGILLARLLGDAEADSDENRSLTPVEEALVEYVVRELFLSPLQQAWAQQKPLQLELEEAEPTRRFGPYRADTRVVDLAFGAQIASRDHSWHLLLPRSSWLHSQVPGAGRDADQNSPGEPVSTEALVKELPLQLTVVLGNAELSLLEMAMLQIGDLVVLDQPVRQPAACLLGDQVKLHVWPGAVGARQAVAIHSFAGVPT